MAATSTPTTISTSSSTFVPSDREWAAFDRVITDATRGARDVSIAVERGGRIVHASVFSSGRTLAIDARFRIGSISKVLTGMAILVLVDEGRIDLDRPVLGDLADRHGWSLADPRMRAITVRQLLAHTSGLAASLPSFFDSPMATPDQAVGQVLALPLVDEPGRSFTYANVNFVLLGRLLQDVTGLDFATASRRLVLDPLGLSSFATVGTADRPAGDAHHWTRAGRNYMELLAAAGAWIASASDVARLVASIESGGVLSPTTRAAMLDPSSTGPLEGGWTYGLGVRLFPDGSYGHSGTLESSRSMALHLPDGTTVAVLVNGEVPKVTDDLIATIDWAATTLGR